METETQPNPLAQGLSLDDLKALEPIVFAKGEIMNKDLPVPMVNVREHPDLKLKWVAKRGGIHDWAIYLNYAHESYEECLMHGQKTTSNQNITFLVPCTPEALKMYRY